jgi:CheY-like chemotaxis protein
MISRIKTVLLIDDDTTINYLHNRLLEKNSFTDKVAISINGMEGLDMFKQLDHQLGADEMAIVFLDLNMPIMNGWEFLDTIANIKDSIKMNYKIYLLSSTINPDDKKKAKENTLVSGFLTKPLTKEHLELLRAEHLQ